MDVANGSYRATTNGLNGGLKPPTHVPLHPQTIVSGTAMGKQRRCPAFLVRILSIVARLTTWYLILTVLFRCPASSDRCDQSTPAVCRVYFQSRNAVAPHIEPYYDAYAAPYVDAVRPYYNALDERLVDPVWAYASRYGAPRLSQATAYGKAQWERKVQPQLLKYQTLASGQYSQSIGPHVDHLSTVLAPYYDIASTNAQQTYYEFLVPTYQLVRPYAQQSYNLVHVFATRTAVPATVRVWKTTYVFVDGAIWPRLRTAYVENVEPQLVKIGQRLGRYSGQQPAMHKTASAVSPAKLSQTVTSYSRPTSSGTQTSSIAVSSTPSSLHSDDATQGSAAGAAHDSPRSIFVEPPEADEEMESAVPGRLR